jgi:hypothetical protein
MRCFIELIHLGNMDKNNLIDAKHFLLVRLGEVENIPH